jgi:hypothetical protein
MAKLLTLTNDSSTEEWENILSSFSKDNATKSDFISDSFTFQKKEEFLRLLLSKFIICKLPSRDTITKYALMVLRLLLRKASSEFVSSATVELVDAMAYLCNFIDPDESTDPDFVIEGYKCIVNILHFDESLRVHFSKILDETKMSAVLKVIRGEKFNPLVARVLFYSIHNENCAKLLYKKYPHVFMTFFDQFCDQIERCDVAQPLIEVYICDSLKLFFTLASHVEVPELFNEK